MRVSSIRYERLKNLGDDINAHSFVDVVVNEGESEVEAVNRAKKFVERHLLKKEKPFNVGRSEGILRNPDDYTGNQIRDAKETIEKWEAENNEGSDEF